MDQIEVSETANIHSRGTSALILICSGLVPRLLPLAYTIQQQTLTSHPHTSHVTCATTRDMDDGAQQTPVERFGALENERDRLLATLEQVRGHAESMCPHLWGLSVTHG